MIFKIIDRREPLSVRNVNLTINELNKQVLRLQSDSKGENNVTSVIVENNKDMLVILDYLDDLMFYEIEIIPSDLKTSGELLKYRISLLAGVTDENNPSYMFSLLRGGFQQGCTLGQIKNFIRDNNAVMEIRM